MPAVTITVEYEADIPQEILDNPELLEELKSEIDGAVLVGSFTTSVVTDEDVEDGTEAEFEVEVEAGDTQYQLNGAPYTVL